MERLQAAVAILFLLPEKPFPRREFVMNYEDLGRYTEASEQARLLAQQRNQTLSKLSSMLGSVVGSSSGGYVAVAMDFEQARALLDLAVRQDAELQEAIAKANAAAPGCEKQPLALWRMSRR